MPRTRKPTPHRIYDMQTRRHLPEEYPTRQAARIAAVRLSAGGGGLRYRVQASVPSDITPDKIKPCPTNNQ